MKRKNEGQTSMLTDKPVPLDDSQVAEKSARIRALRRVVKGLKAEVRKTTATAKKDIADAETEMDLLIELIDQGIELRRQGDLFVDKQALAGVAKKAGEPKPSEPHAFEGMKGKPFECVTCGSSPTDPVHGNGKTGDAFAFTGSETPDEVIRTHAAVDLGGVSKARTAKRGKGPLGRKRREARA